MFYLGHVLTALLVGYLSNRIAMWYLFMGTIVLHILGYSLYALSVTGWMMLLSRILAGISMGAAIAVSFAYFGFSTVKYAENLTILGEYDPKHYAKVKGFVFSLFNIGTGVGFIVGACMFHTCNTNCILKQWYVYSLVFPIALAQFDVDQFRPPGWFCAGIGVLLLLLQLAIFRGECTCVLRGNKASTISMRQISRRLRDGKLKCSEVLCGVSVSLQVCIFCAGYISHCFILT